ncbi:MAG: DUF2892 domain-containing protein [Myxococcales bacterium]|nr:DUF2892 domain-containing protein [Myxococcales bacterium]
MTKNVGNVDKIVRVLLGLGLLSLFFVLGSPWKWLGLVALIPLGTAAMGFCPLYRVFGLSTCPLQPGAGPSK